MATGTLYFAPLELLAGCRLNVLALKSSSLVLVALLAIAWAMSYAKVYSRRCDTAEFVWADGRRIDALYRHPGPPPGERGEPRLLVAFNMIESRDGSLSIMQERMSVVGASMDWWCDLTLDDPVRYPNDPDVMLPRTVPVIWNAPLRWPHMHAQESLPQIPGSRTRDVASKLCVPYWLLMLLCGIPLEWQAMVAMRRRHHARHGRCRNCGYDLRESRTRCPECGAIFQMLAKRDPDSDT